jgi:hypothetical protein
MASCQCQNWPNDVCNPKRIRPIPRRSARSYRHLLCIAARFRNNSGFVEFGPVVVEKNAFFLQSEEKLLSHQLKHEPLCSMTTQLEPMQLNQQQHNRTYHGMQIQEGLM